MRASAVFWPDPREAKTIGELCKKYQVTIAIATATFLRIYMKRCQPDDFRTVRLFPCGAEKLPVELQEEFERKFGLRPVEGYGCTELSPVVAVNVPDRTVNGLTQVGTKPGSIGQPSVTANT